MRQRMWVWGIAHAVDDLYQGLVPAALPYFALDRHYGYVAISGLTLAATLGSSVPQPLFGILADRYRLGWLAAAGVATAGVGFGLSGLLPAYGMVWTLILISGLGVAMFHPSAGKAAREAAGDSAAAMSPALAIAMVLLRKQRQADTAKRTDKSGLDRWRPFAALTGLAVVRSMTYFGVLTFIELYWLRYLHASKATAGAALACFLLGGVAGTLLGGRIADRFGMVRTVRFGALIAIPTLAALRFSTGPVVPLIAAVVAGIALNIPFAVLVKLGQDYLPGRPGTAAGVTLGLAVSIGGLIAPVLGVIAQHRGPQGVLTVLCVTPALALLFALVLPEPRTDQALAIHVG